LLVAKLEQEETYRKNQIKSQIEFEKFKKEMNEREE